MKSFPKKSNQKTVNQYCWTQNFSNSNSKVQRREGVRANLKLLKNLDFDTLQGKKCEKECKYDMGDLVTLKLTGQAHGSVIKDLNEIFR